MVTRLEFFCEVCGPLAPDCGGHLLALLFRVGEDGGALLVVRFLVKVVLLADVLVALVHGLRVTEDPEAEREKEKIRELGDGLLCRVTTST